MTMAVGSGSNAPQRYQRVSLRANTSSEHNRLDACRGSRPLRRLGGFRWQPLFPDYGSAETQSALALWRKRGRIWSNSRLSCPDLCRLLVKSNSGALFIAKRHEGIYARGTVSGPEAGQSCHRG